MKEPHTQKSILATAWIVILAVSLLEIIIREVFHYSISESNLLVFEALIVLGGTALTFFWKTIRSTAPVFRPIHCIIERPMAGLHAD